MEYWRVDLLLSTSKEGSRTYASNILIGARGIFFTPFSWYQPNLTEALPIDSPNTRFSANRTEQISRGGAVWLITAALFSKRWLVFFPNWIWRNCFFLSFSLSLFLSFGCLHASWSWALAALLEKAIVLVLQNHSICIYFVHLIALRQYIKAV